MEVEITSEDLICSLARKDDLDAHLPNVLGENVHGSGGTDGGHVVRLQMPNELVDDGDTLLESDDDELAFIPILRMLVSAEVLYVSCARRRIT